MGPAQGVDDDLPIGVEELVRSAQAGPEQLAGGAGRAAAGALVFSVMGVSRRSMEEKITVRGTNKAVPGQAGKFYFNATHCFS